MRKVHGIIPARYASTRFPGKPLATLNGKPMFWHVWQRASLSKALSSVTLATDDKRIAAVAQEYSIPVVMTQDTHQSGTDRVQEAASLLGFADSDIILNIQGDEPALNPAALDELAEAFTDQTVQVATLAHPIMEEDLHNPNKVKVVLSAQGNALYFSRSAIPYIRTPDLPFTPLGHIGLYGFTGAALRTFVALPPSPLELLEQLEQLRLLENHIPIRVVLTTHVSHGVDSPTDLERVIKLLQ